MGENGALWMRRATLLDLPEWRLPDGFAVHGEEADAPAEIEWILSGLGCADGAKVAEALLSSRSLHAYIAREYCQDAAFVLVAPTPEGEALLSGPFAHPWHDDRRAGYWVALSALTAMRDMGLTSAAADASVLSPQAVADCLALGFVPAEDARWDKVMKEVEAVKGQVPQVIPLWEGEAPFTDQCGSQAQPSVKAFPVEGARGAVVVCPGGGYAMKASHEGDPIARMLGAAGIAAYVLDYRVMPCPFEAPLADASRAIRLVRSMGYEKVGILGFSAGGHLTCSAATLYTPGDPSSDDPVERLSSRPDAFIPCYAVVSFASFRHQGSLQNLLGERAEDLQLIRRYSAELHVDGDTPPAFIWHTANDPVVPVENSLDLAGALAHASVPFELHVYPDGPHGLGLAGGKPPVDGWGAACQKFLLDLGFGRV